MNLDKYLSNADWTKQTNDLDLPMTKEEQIARARENAKAKKAEVDGIFDEIAEGRDGNGDSSGE